MSIDVRLLLLLLGCSSGWGQLNNDYQRWWLLVAVTQWRGMVKTLSSDEREGAWRLGEESVKFEDKSKIF